MKNWVSLFLISIVVTYDRYTFKSQIGHIFSEKGTQISMSQNPFSLKGSCLVAMVGKDCVAIASDKRLGVRMQTISTNFQKIFRINDRIFIGLTGLASDIQTVREHLRFQVNLIELQEDHPLDPRKFSALVKSLLYEHRFGSYFISPIIAGLQEDNTPFLATSDSIGAMSYPNNFAVGGTADDCLYGICESMWRENMNKDELFEVISACLQAAQERDGGSGWGGIVYLITPEQVTVKEIKVRMD